MKALNIIGNIFVGLFRFIGGLIAGIINILVSLIIILLNVYVSWNHTLALFQQGGFSREGYMDIAAVCAIELMFLFGTCHLMVARIKGRFPRWEDVKKGESLGVVFTSTTGIGLIMWSNIRAGVDYGKTGVILGIVVPLSIVFCEWVLADAWKAKAKQEEFLRSQTSTADNSHNEPQVISHNEDQTSSQTESQKIESQPLTEFEEDTHTISHVDSQAEPQEDPQKIDSQTLTTTTEQSLTESHNDSLTDSQEDSHVEAQEDSQESETNSLTQTEEKPQDDPPKKTRKKSQKNPPEVTKGMRVARRLIKKGEKVTINMLAEKAGITPWYARVALKQLEIEEEKKAEKARQNDRPLQNSSN